MKETAKAEMERGQLPDSEMFWGASEGSGTGGTSGGVVCGTPIVRKVVRVLERVVVLESKQGNVRRGREK